MNDGVYLKKYLEPLEPWLSDPDVTDIMVNRPGEIWVETVTGEVTAHVAPNLTEVDLARLARQVAGASSQGINREQPILSAALPEGARGQFIAPPATRAGLVLAVRKHSLSDFSIADLKQAGMFDRRDDVASLAKLDADLGALLAAGDFGAFLSKAVMARKTMVISGGTATGKTTLLNALVKEIDARERLILIEDAPEIKLDRPNAVGLVAVRGGLGESNVTVDDLLQGALRMRPDRIMLGELRGAEAFAFLRAINTGHPGSLTTVHADSPAGALDQIAMLALLSGVDMDWHAIRAFGSRVIDVIVQLRRFEGKRFIGEIMFKPTHGERVEATAFT